MEEKVIEENATLYAAYLASLRNMVTTTSSEFIFEVICELVELYQRISRQAKDSEVFILDRIKRQCLVKGVELGEVCRWAFQSVNDLLRHALDVGEAADVEEVELYKHEHGQNPADVKKALDDVSVFMVESAHVPIDQLHLEFHEEVLLLAH